MYPDKQQLLDSIKPDMKLDRLFFLKAYGYEISFPGFADEAIKALEDAGCSKARKYYETIVGEYQNRKDEELRKLAWEIRKRWGGEWKKLQERGDKNADGGEAPFSNGLPQDW